MIRASRDCARFCAGASREMAAGRVFSGSV